MYRSISQYTPVSVFRAGKDRLLSLVKLLVSRKAQEEYVRAKYQKSWPKHIWIQWDFFSLLHAGDME